MNITNEYAKDYSESGFWKKVTKYAAKAGKELITKALQLYYALQSPNTPVWAKTTIIGALGYFISPIDLIPDIVPVVGYTDDLGVLTAALFTVSSYIDDDMKKRAETKVKEWFS